MLKATNETLIPGIYTAANPAPGKGSVIYKNNEWKDEKAEKPFTGDLHIQAIACGYE
jgi:hypothetical protein